MKQELPFPLPAELPARCARVLDYWRRLRRAENPMPFADDIVLSAVPGAQDDLFLVETFTRPQRFRVNEIGRAIRDTYGADLRGKFVDEIEPAAPLGFLLAQSSATVEARAPTFFRSPGGQRGYARLMLPSWGHGRIELILGCIETLE